MRFRALFVVSAALVVLGAACSDDTSESLTTTASSVDPTTTTTTMAEHGDEHGDAEDTSDATIDDGVVVEVDMVEFAFEDGPFEVPVGESVTFRFVNTGAVAHEAMFGDAHQQEEFAASGEDHGSHGDGDGEQGHHGEVTAITVEAGETGEITVTFDEPGEVLMGCHIEGHFDAGMVAPITVV